MNSKLIRKIAIDFGMTVLLMLLMAFELIGRAAHEWIGMGMFALFIIHHALNWNWRAKICFTVNILFFVYCKQYPLPPY